MDEKPPFQTRAEIERQIRRGGLSEVEIRQLWDCLFLMRPEIDGLVKHVGSTYAQPFLYPMVCLAAHTGARRSELLRLRVDDVDLNVGTVLLHEKTRYALATPFRCFDRIACGSTIAVEMRPSF
jgi:integrase